MHPDLVIGTTNGNRKEAVDKLAMAGIPVYVTNPQRFSNIAETIVNIGRITGPDAAARKLSGEMKRKADRIVSPTAHCRKPKSLCSDRFDPLISIGRNKIKQNYRETEGGGGGVLILRGGNKANWTVQHGVVIKEDRTFY